MEMKPNLNVVSFVRLGLCIAAAILLTFFLTFAVKQQLSYVYPFGLLFVFIYTLMVVFGFKKVYPVASRAVGQLCFTFLLVALNGFNQYKKALKPAEQTKELIEQSLFNASVYHAQAKVAIQAVFILFAAYIILRIMDWRKSKAKNNGLVKKSN